MNKLWIDDIKDRHIDRNYITNTEHVFRDILVRSWGAFIHRKEGILNLRALLNSDAIEIQ